MIKVIDETSSQQRKEEFRDAKPRMKKVFGEKNLAGNEKVSRKRQTGNEKRDRGDVKSALKFEKEFRGRQADNEESVWRDPKSAVKTFQMF